MLFADLVVPIKIDAEVTCLSEFHIQKPWKFATSTLRCRVDDDVAALLNQVASDAASVLQVPACELVGNQVDMNLKDTGFDKLCKDTFACQFVCRGAYIAKSGLLKLRIDLISWQ